MSELGRLAARELSSLPRGIGEVHAAISARVFRAVGPVGAPVRVWHNTVARGTYEAVRGGLWLAATAATQRIPDDHDATLAALNGLIGDELEASGSPLAIPMAIHRRGEPGPDVAVFVHGLGGLERYWGYADQLDHSP